MLWGRANCLSRLRFNQTGSGPGRFCAEPAQELLLTESVKKRTLSLDARVTHNAAVTDESREAIMEISRRALLAGGLTLITSVISGSGAAAAKPTITVYKSPT